MEDWHPDHIDVECIGNQVVSMQGGAYGRNWPLAAARTESNSLFTNGGFAEKLPFARL